MNLAGRPPQSQAQCRAFERCRRRTYGPAAPVLRAGLVYFRDTRPDTKRKCGHPPIGWPHASLQARGRRGYATPPPETLQQLGVRRGAAVRFGTHGRMCIWIPDAAVHLRVALARLVLRGPGLRVGVVSARTSGEGPRLASRGVRARADSYLKCERPGGELHVPLPPSVSSQSCLLRHPTGTAPATAAAGVQPCVPSPRPQLRRPAPQPRRDGPQRHDTQSAGARCTAPGTHPFLSSHT